MKVPNEILHALRAARRRHDLDRSVAAWAKAASWIGHDDDRLSSLADALTDDQLDHLPDTLERLVAMNRIDEARRFVAAVDVILNGEGVTLLVSNLAAAGYLDEAQQENERGLKVRPHAPQLLLGSAILAGLRGEHERAEQQFRKALENARDAETIEMIIGHQIAFLKERGRFEEAEELEDKWGFEDFEDDVVVVPKTERNAPCPCGSGRKYKKCCGANTVAESVRSPYTDLFERLVEYRDRRGPDVAALLARYLDVRDPELLGTPTHAAVFDWLQFDVPGEDGRTLAELFREKNGARLSPFLRETLDSLIASHLGLYEIREVADDGNATLRHTLLGTEHTIGEPLSPFLVEGEFIAVRLFTSEGREQTTLGAIDFSAKLAERLLEALGKELLGRTPDLSWMKRAASTILDCAMSNRQ